MNWVYLSPHLDDVALSAGGLVWEQVQAGQVVHIWTICAGDPPDGELSPFAQSIHARWGIGSDAIAGRRQEDLHSCQIMGALADHFHIPDCIYRRSDKTGAHLYASEEALWYPVHADEQALVLQMAERLRERLSPLLPDIRLVSPLTLGNHVDHRLTRAAAEKTGLPLYFYADFPYVLRTGFTGQTRGLDSRFFTISTQGMESWQAAIAAHHSQIGTFWNSLEDMRTEISGYYQQFGGIWIGQPLFTGSRE
jgi:LmbE family N-acetylglucosaminyl deacetylase